MTQVLSYYDNVPPIQRGREIVVVRAPGATCYRLEIFDPNNTNACKVTLFWPEDYGLTRLEKPVGWMQLEEAIRIADAYNAQLGGEMYES